jgi:hypothetical protein
MLSLAEPGHDLEAHRRSPVRSAGTKRDSSHRIAGYPPCSAECVTLGSAGRIHSTTRLSCLSFRPISHYCHWCRLGNLQQLVKK